MIILLLIFNKLSRFFCFYLQDIENYIISAHKKQSDMWTELSDPAILQKMGRRIRDYRMRMEMTQSELAVKSGVSL